MQRHTEKHTCAEMQTHTQEDVHTCSRTQTHTHLYLFIFCLLQQCEVVTAMVFPIITPTCKIFPWSSAPSLSLSLSLYLYLSYLLYIYILYISILYYCTHLSSVFMYCMYLIFSIVYILSLCLSSALYITLSFSLSLYPPPFSLSFCLTIFWPLLSCVYK